MRLTSIEASDFLSFEELSFDLDPGLNVVVGPNGAGKSNLVRILDLVTNALEWSDGNAARAEAELSRYATSRRQGATGHGFSVRVGVELDQSWERHLIVSFVRAAAISAVLALTSDEARDGEIRQEITEDSLQAFFRGKLAITFDARPGGGWEVGYEFDHVGTGYCYMLRGRASDGLIVSGRLAPGQSHGRGGPILVSRLLPQGYDQPFSFDLASLLPTADGDARLDIEPFDQARLTPTLREFAELAEVDVTQRRVYTLASILRRIVRGSLVIRADQRLPPREEYPPAALATQPPLTDVSQLPLELLRLKEGALADRERYRQVQAVFREFTSRDFDLRLRAVPGADHHRVELWVIEDGREVPIRLAGAGRWEAVTLSAAIVEAPGRVVIFDEPAVNIDLTLQGKLLADLGGVDGQVLLITHSPLLVPAQSIDDLRCIIRLQRRRGKTELRRLAAAATAATDKRGSRWLQILSGSSDARAMLFAAGVVLVEGDTELGAFQQWFQQCPTAARSGTPQARNVVILSVSGDQGFEAYVEYLQAFGIPWAIVCDGPVLSPDHPGSAFEQLARAGVQAIPAATPGPGKTPLAIPCEFEACRSLAEQHGVFTLTETFTEEIEAALERFDPTAWGEAVRVERRSKVRRGRYFAQEVPCPTQVDNLYQRLLAHLDRKHAK